MVEKRTKTTKIEKKWKDKKTGEWKKLTIDYAKVADRIKVFWEENPRGKITTEPIINDQGQVIFKAHILRDKADEFSKEATGHTLGVHENEKDFEKLETLAVGRALALLGYGGSGEIASSEEMEEFLKFQENKEKKLIEESQEKIESAKSVNNLKTIWSALPAEAKIKLETVKDKMKEKLIEKELDKTFEEEAKKVKKGVK